MSSILPHQQAVVDLVRDIFGPDFIPLHRPVFEGNERQYLVDCIDSNFVSSVGAKVTEFEQQVAAFTGARFAIATVNGTAALERTRCSSMWTAIPWA
jgi:perosamine synthetase